MAGNVGRMSENQLKPTRCPECGAALKVLRRDAVDALGHDKPVRVDWDFGCTADPSHATVHWIEYP